MAVGEDVIGATDAARYDYVQIAVQARQRCIRVEEEGKVVDGENLAFRAARGEYEIGGVEDVERAAGECFYRRPRRIEPVPQANHIAFVQRGTVQRKGSLGGLLRRDPPNREQPPVELRTSRNQGVDLAADNAPNPGLLPYRRRIVNSNGVHDSRGLQTAIRPQAVRGEVQEHDADGKELGEVVANQEAKVWAERRDQERLEQVVDGEKDELVDAEADHRYDNELEQLTAARRVWLSGKVHSLLSEKF